MEQENLKSIKEIVRDYEAWKLEMKEKIREIEKYEEILLENFKDSSEDRQVRILKLLADGIVIKNKMRF